MGTCSASRLSPHCSHVHSLSYRIDPPPRSEASHAMTGKLSDNGLLFAAAAILFVLTLLAGTVPVHLIEIISKRFAKSKSASPANETVDKPKSSLCTQLQAIFTKDRIVQFLAQLGGGVLLYTALIHMLPEIRENYENYLKDKNNSTGNATSTSDEEEDSLPLVDFCACAGFFGIFLIEELMHTFFLKNHDHHHHQTPASEQAKVKNHSPLTRRLSMRQYIQSRKHYSPHVNEGDAQSGTRTNGSYKQGQEFGLTETAPISATCQPSRYDACQQSDVAIDSNGK